MREQDGSPLAFIFSYVCKLNYLVVRLRKSCSSQQTMVFLKIKSKQPVVWAGKRNFVNSLVVIFLVDRNRIACARKLGNKSAVQIWNEHDRERHHDHQDLPPDGRSGSPDEQQLQTRHLRRAHRKKSKKQSLLARTRRVFGSSNASSSSSQQPSSALQKLDHAAQAGVENGKTAAGGSGVDQIAAQQQTRSLVDPKSFRDRIPKSFRVELAIQSLPDPKSFRDRILAEGPVPWDSISTSVNHADGRIEASEWEKAYGHETIGVFNALDDPQTEDNARGYLNKQEYGALTYWVAGGTVRDANGHFHRACLCKSLAYDHNSGSRVALRITDMETRLPEPLPDFAALALWDFDGSKISLSEFRDGGANAFGNISDGTNDFETQMEFAEDLFRCVDGILDGTASGFIEWAEYNRFVKDRYSVCAAFQRSSVDLEQGAANSQRGPIRPAGQLGFYPQGEEEKPGPGIPGDLRGMATANYGTDPAQAGEPQPVPEADEPPTTRTTSSTTSRPTSEESPWMLSDGGASTDAAPARNLHGTARIISDAATRNEEPLDRNYNSSTTTESGATVSVDKTDQNTLHPAQFSNNGHGTTTSGGGTRGGSSIFHPDDEPQTRPSTEALLGSSSENEKQDSTRRTWFGRGQRGTTDSSDKSEVEMKDVNDPTNNNPNESEPPKKMSSLLLALILVSVMLVLTLLALAVIVSCTTSISLVPLNYDNDGSGAGTPRRSAGANYRNSFVHTGAGAATETGTAGEGTTTTGTPFDEMERKIQYEQNKKQRPLISYDMSTASFGNKNFITSSTLQSAPLSSSTVAGNAAVSGEGLGLESGAAAGDAAKGSSTPAAQIVSFEKK
ncbi:unnamed protein product [Amoebophrya sp. A120]|nr:unnamed protein product [Amoebophrya sp. A120]|eukprot:GSA120T00014016001.1